MRILIVPDKFKGSLSASQVARAIAQGIHRRWPKAKVTELPLSDGGEGFVETLTQIRSGRLASMRTVDPLGRACLAKYGLLPDDTAVVGLTEASGLWRVPLPQRNPGKVTTVGTGVLIHRLIQQGCRQMIIGLGGSATNDGGIGLAIPSGFRFLDRRGRDIPPNGEGLARLDRILPPPSVHSTKLIVATDVENPLFGAEGAAFQYAAQKGAKPIQVRRLDRYLRHLAKVTQSSLGFSQHHQPGAGAAGGCGYGLMTFLGAQRQSGFELFRTWSKLDQLIDQHDLVITGEGCLDRTSVQGKGPWAVAQLARQRGKPVWAICGSCRLDLVQTPFTQIGQVISVARDLTHAQRRAATHVRALAKALAAASS